MNKKLLGVIIVITSVAILSGIVYVMFLNTSEKTAEKEVSEVSEEFSGEEEQKESLFPVKPIKEEIRTIIHSETQVAKPEVTEADLRRMAGLFAERFGSYSNQSNYGNISDLKIFMSSRMQEWADDYIGQIRGKETLSTLYYGITTKAIFQEVVTFDNNVGTAQVLVKALRREATGTMANATSFYQDVIISFVKEGGVWKVDSANWQAT